MTATPAGCLSLVGRADVASPPKTSPIRRVLYRHVQQEMIVISLSIITQVYIATWSYLRYLANHKSRNGLVHRTPSKAPVPSLRVAIPVPPRHSARSLCCFGDIWNAGEPRVTRNDPEQHPNVSSPLVRASYTLVDGAESHGMPTKQRFFAACPYSFSHLVLLVDVASPEGIPADLPHKDTPPPVLAAEGGDTASPPTLLARRTSPGPPHHFDVNAEEQIARQRAFRCRICPAIDHPTPLCPLPSLTSWLGPTPATIAALEEASRAAAAKTQEQIRTNNFGAGSSNPRSRNVRGQGAADSKPRKDGKGKRGGDFKGKGKRRERYDFF
ncbi:hypothetical protein DFH09DRAFT_1282755 [Mycena vulgaris]|nr:hypothetical protein DFH09DRAFT_1282755 [Mycena vulgaris]